MTSILFLWLMLNFLLSHIHVWCTAIQMEFAVCSLTHCSSRRSQRVNKRIDYNRFHTRHWKNVYFILSCFKEQTGTKLGVTKSSTVRMILIHKLTDFNPLPMLAGWYNLISHMNYPSVWSREFRKIDLSCLTFDLHV